MEQMNIEKIKNTAIKINILTWNWNVLAQVNLTRVKICHLHKILRNVLCVCHLNYHCRCLPQTQWSNCMVWILPGHSEQWKFQVTRGWGLWGRDLVGYFQNDPLKILWVCTFSVTKKSMIFHDFFHHFFRLFHD